LPRFFSPGGGPVRGRRGGGGEGGSAVGAITGSEGRARRGERRRGTAQGSPPPPPLHEALPPPPPTHPIASPTSGRRGGTATVEKLGAPDTSSGVGAAGEASCERWGGRAPSNRAAGGRRGDARGGTREGTRVVRFFPLGVGTRKREGQKGTEEFVRCVNVIARAVEFGCQSW